MTQKSTEKNSPDKRIPFVKNLIRRAILTNGFECRIEQFPVTGKKGNYFFEDFFAFGVFLRPLTGAIPVEDADPIGESFMRTHISSL